MTNYVTVAVAVLVCIIAGCGKQTQTPASNTGNAPAESSSEAADPKEAAAAVAETWLALVDDGKFAESWTESASVFQAAVPQNQWENTMVQQRRPIGSANSRTLTQSQHTTSLPGAPAGEYVVIQYTTDFVKKKGVTETVTAMLDNDRGWRVSGYYIK